MEIGSFVPLSLKESGEYFIGDNDIARLNSARAGIYYSCRVYGCKSIYIPYYLCPTVRGFLIDQGINVEYYFIGNGFEPLNISQEDNYAILLVNYFGILSFSRMNALADQFKNVIIDNSAAFYCPPLNGCFNVYSPRKFFGVPDGCYVIGDRANDFVKGLDRDVSSMTSGFLLKRIEFSLEETYGERMKNEERIDNSGVLRMSMLTQMLLGNIDYLDNLNKRKNNFDSAHELFGKMNQINPTQEMDGNCTPMVYPLALENSDLDIKLREKSVFVGRLWNSVLLDVSEDKYEAWLSRYLIPIPIDQRYGSEELKYIYDIIIRNFDL